MLKSQLDGLKRVQDKNMLKFISNHTPNEECIRLDMILTNRDDVKQRLIAINTHENYTKKFFDLLDLFKNIQEDRRKNTGHYLSGETNKLMQSLKEIDRIDTCVF